MDFIASNNSSRSKNYDRIKRLALKLQEPGNVKERRKLALELEQLMSSYDVRAALAREATPTRRGPNDLSVAATRCLALSTLWTTVFTAAIGFTVGIIKGGAKPTPADIGFPDKLLRAATGPDQVFDTEGIAIPKLNRKTMRAILKFCLEMLDDDKVIECGGEIQMLEMLARICSRPEYLGFIKDSKFPAILSEITCRLTDEVSTDVHLVACKAFDAFFDTSSQLGRPFHMFLSDCIGIVASFCQDSLQENSVIAASVSRMQLFNAAASMLFAHPDHAMGPMKRYGRHILRFCKKAYANASPNHMEAFDKYLLAHLFVSQVAGHVQGRLCGDLGNLGESTLSERDLADFLKLVVVSTSKVLDTTDTKPKAAELRVKKQKLTGETMWRKLDSRQKFHLELAARLLSCSQRLYLAREGRETLPDEELTSLVVASNPNRDKDSTFNHDLPDHPRLSLQALSKSPWMSIVLRGLVVSANIGTYSNASQKSGSGEFSLDGLDSRLHVIETLTDNEVRLLESPVPFLAIVAACCECFPGGECWASDPAINWKRSNERDEFVTHFNTSSPSDLGLLLFVLSRLLEFHGRPDCDPVVQSWILLCLTKLAETTSVIRQAKDYIQTAVRFVVRSWRHIWKVLFRTDLQYISHSNILCEHSIGELTLILLTEIVRWKCTEMSRVRGDVMGNKDASFIVRNQSDIWDLPQLSSRAENKLTARCFFELVSTIIQTVGLSEPPNRGVSDQNSSSRCRSLRQRLVRLCLHYFEKVMRRRVVSVEESIAKDRLLSAIASCLITLSTATAVLAHAFSSQEPRFFLTSILHCGRKATEKTDETIVSQSSSQQHLTRMWTSCDYEYEEPIGLKLGSLSRAELDLPLRIANTIRDHLRREDHRNFGTTADFVSDQESEELCSHILLFVDRKLSVFVGADQNSQNESSEGSPASGPTSSNLLVDVGAAKFVLSLFVARADGLTSKIHERIPSILILFQRAVGELSRNTFKAGDYLTVSSDLQKMAMTFIEMQARAQVNLEGIGSVVVRCRDILKRYEQEINRVDQTDNKVQRDKNHSNIDVRFSDDEDCNTVAHHDGIRNKNESDTEDSFDSSNKKRKSWVNKELARKRRKTEKTILSPPACECALEIGKLLLVLDPTPANAGLVCEALLRTELDLEPDSVHGDIDLRLAEACVQLLGMKNVLLNSCSRKKFNLEVGSENQSIVVIMCRTIELIRVCAAPTSKLFMYGVEACAQALVDLIDMGLDISEHEERLFLDIIADESEAYSVCPALVIRRLRSASHAFAKGSDSFRMHFGGAYASIVKKSMSDGSYLVRRLAYKSAGVAMKALDERRVLKSINDLTPPICQGENDAKIISAFSTWFAQSPFADKCGQQEMVARDSLEVFESNALLAKAILAESTQNTGMFLEILIEILRIPLSRCDLELLCFRSMESIALSKGYSSVQEMIDLEADALLSIMFQDRNEEGVPGKPITNFSLCLTAPLLMGWLETYAQYDRMTGTPISLEGDDGCDDLRRYAMIRFVSVNRSFLLPFLLVENCGNVEISQSHESTIVDLSQSPSFRIFLDMLPTENGDRDNITKLLKKSIVDILAFCSPYLHSGDPLQESRGRAVQQVLANFLSDDFIKAKTSNNVSLLVRRIMGLYGKAGVMQNIVPTSDEPYYRSVLSHLQAVSQSRKTNGDIFLQLGTSLTELAIEASRELDKFVSANHRSNNWSQFQLLGRFLTDQLLRKQPEENLQLGFFLHVATEILLKSSLEVIRPRVLMLIDDILQESLQLDKEFLKTEASASVQRLLAVCFHIHEWYQRRILHSCRTNWYNTEMDMRRSCGIDLPFSDADGVVSWDTSQSESLVGSDLERIMKMRPPDALEDSCLTGTFDVIHRVVESKGSFGLDPYIFESLCSPDEISKVDLDALYQINVKYCAQNIAEIHDWDCGELDILKQCASRLEKRVESPHSWVIASPRFDGPSKLRINGSALNIDQRLLHAELLQIERLLGVVDTEDVPFEGWKSLTGNLLFICHANCPMKLRFAASRCIAMLKPSIVIDAADLANERGQTNMDAESDLISVLHAKCIDCLTESLKSPETKVSSSAMAILKGLLSTNMGRKAYDLVNDTSKSILKPFIYKIKSKHSNLVVLSDDELRSLTSRIDVHADDVPTWCWNSQLWGQINDVDANFEEWICSVTTAIILCCFRKNSGEGNHGNVVIDAELRDFFWRCQVGTLLDHRFASAVFPCLVLALLDIECNFTSDGVSISEGSKAITSAVQTLLHGSRDLGISGRSSRGTPRYKAVSLVIDTLDFTRKISQKTFMASMRRPATPRKTVDLIPWDGLQFGIVLQLDGIQVAEACMEVQRFPSALFYIELYLNAQFGKAGGLFEDLSNEMSHNDIVGHFRPRPDISGLRLHSHPQNDAGPNDSKSKSLKVMSDAATCFKELHEYEAVEATEMQFSSLSLMEGVYDCSSLEIKGRLDDFAKNTVGIPRTFDRIERVRPGVVDALQELGLHGVIKAYMEGVSTQHSGLKDLCQEEMLRERWFESNLDAQNWNKLAIESGRGDAHQHFGSLDRAKPQTDLRYKIGYFESVSRALKFFSRDNMEASAMYLKQARLRLVDSVIEMGGEQAAVDGIVDIIDKSRALKDLDVLIEDKTLQERFDFDEADLLAVSLGMREVTLAAKAVRCPERREFFEALKNHLWTSCTLAVDRRNPSRADDSLSKLRLLSSEVHKGEEQTSVDVLRTRFEEAKIMECRGDFIAATRRTQQLVGHLLALHKRAEDQSTKGILADVQLLCGHWMTKYKTQHAKVVLETYLLPAVDCAKQILASVDSTENSNRLTRGSIQVGHVFANLFDSLLSRVQSIEWKEAGERLEKQQLQLRESLLGLPKSSKAKETVEYQNLNRFCAQLKLENEKLEKERKMIQESIPRYLSHSLDSFLVAFKTAGTASDDLSSHIFRMVSLWFCSHEENLIDEDLGAALEKELCGVPSFRFVPLTNQLFSRIELIFPGQDLFQRALQNLIFKMCNDHPYHCLVPLLTLANGNSKQSGDSKVTASKGIIQKLTKDGVPYVSKLVRSYEILIAAYNETAYADVTELVNKNRTKKVKFSEILKTSKSSFLDQCLRNRHPRPCVLTSPPSLRPKKDYGDGKDDPEGTERVCGFEPFFDLTDSGIHRPRIVTCLGSKGGRFRQLVKGEDEVRQDAIMSQIFTYVNHLMARGESDQRVEGNANKMQVGTRRSSRKIKIATYNVLPLSPMSGVLEWVQNTMPIMNYLEGTDSAHSRYYPNEWDYRLCGRHLKGETTLSKKRESKNDLFAEVCSKYSPCFRFFFMERFSDSAEAWHTAKMKYTRSVAINSIVGHVLGIGDRHLSNILIHTTTGAVVHIDFGIVFEQGKLLAIPELVPFRLTRNIVDGMGPCGTEGTFKSAAEETMSTLRKNARDLLTILSAVVADPLYRWQTDPIEARQRQTEKDDDGAILASKRKSGKKDQRRTKESVSAETNVTSKDNKNQAAVKTIERIKQKLEGYEDSTFGDQQGVEGQVQLLINSARDPDLLKSMYVGWGPWM